MSQRKVRVGVIFGGRSAEHEVSLQSALNIVNAIDSKKYEVICIKIAKDGRWLTADTDIIFNTDGSEANELLLRPGINSRDSLVIKETQVSLELDVIFPILHGTYGEDGTMQGMLKLCGLPFVGASILGSSVGMDKDAMKRLLREAGLPVAEAVVVEYDTKPYPTYEEVCSKLGDVLFVKPANLGSSVGVSKVKTAEEYSKALQAGFEYDNKLIIEEFVLGREIECAVLGNENPKASILGEIVPQHEFYSYEAKYTDPNGALLKIPADLSEDHSSEIRDLAVRAYKALYCEGMGRVDFLVRECGDAVVNEINTLPGFTAISMYPKLWEATGIMYSDLIDQLIKLAMERYEKEQRLRVDYF